MVDITQDAAGYLWIATQRGVNRFDGRDFEHFTIADGLPANFSSAIATGQAGDIWVGNKQGSVALIRGERVVNVVEPPTQDVGMVTSIVVADRYVFVGTENAGLLVIETTDTNPTMTPVSSVTGSAIDLSIHDGELWFVLDSALYTLTIGTTGQPIMKHTNVSRHFAYAHEKHWVTNDSDRLVVIDKQGRQILDRTADSTPIRAAIFDLSGRLWLAGVDYLESYDVFDNGTHIALSKIRRHAEIRDASTLLVDAENRLWAGTSQSLLRFLGYRFSHYRVTSSEQTAAVWDIAQDDDNNYYFGTDTDVVMMDSAGTITSINAVANIPVGPARALVADRNNHLWIGVRGFGLYKFNASTRSATLVPRPKAWRYLIWSWSLPATSGWQRPIAAYSLLPTNAAF